MPLPLDPDLPLPSDSPHLCPETGRGCAVITSSTHAPAPAPLLVEVVGNGPLGLPPPLALHLSPASLPTGLLGLPVCTVPRPTGLHRTCTQALADSPSEKCPIQAPWGVRNSMKAGTCSQRQLQPCSTLHSLPVSPVPLGPGCTQRGSPPPWARCRPPLPQPC